VVSRRDSGQSGVAAMSVVVSLVAVEFPFKIALVPKQSLIEVLAPYAPDQALDESMRTGCAGNRLELINLKDPQVRLPALKTKQRIVIGGKMFWHGLFRDRAIEHPADAGTVEIGGGDAEAQSTSPQAVNFACPLKTRGNPLQTGGNRAQIGGKHSENS